MSLPTNHSKIAHKMKFNYHTDPGHGWLAVKLDLVRELGLATQISPYSYMKGKTAYLEEDCDMRKFMDAFHAKFGILPNINALDQRNASSPIRSMPQFKMEA